MVQCQLDNNHELTPFSYKERKENNDHVGGSFVLPDGKTIPLKKNDIDIKVLDYWHSSKTDADYPALWEVTVKSLDLKT